MNKLLLILGFAVFRLLMQTRHVRGNACVDSLYMKIQYTTKQIDNYLSELAVSSAYECLELCRNHGTCKSVGIETSTIKCLLYDNRIYAGLAGTLSSDLIYYWLLEESECPKHLGYNEHSISKICTKYNSTKVTWDAAQSQCEGDGGFLFILDTPDSQIVMKEYVNAGLHRYTFLGATDKNEEAVWEWFNGVPINRSMFTPSDPNNFRDDQHCVVYDVLALSLLSLVDLFDAITNDVLYRCGFRNAFLYEYVKSGAYFVFSNVRRYESNYFSTAEHGGTHLDAPAHFFKGSWRVQEIPPERLIGPVVVINITQKASSNPDYRVQIEDITQWESDHGQIPAGSIVLMKSGWTVRYAEKKDYFNSQEPSNPDTFHFPSFHEDAVEWLIKHRDISIVGVDTASVDYGQSKTFPVHQMLGKYNIPGLENVAFLEKIPENGATIFVGIIKLHDGSGGPVRLLATFDPESSNQPPTNQIVYWALLLSFLLLIYNICR
ncbi:hypothetical protein LOTGIDRAFT_167971 [Lottia gigantea]|uniref:Apple domain-containing protein n=1 Tax=Lottia gigantea TaxID=225164 RepID=V4B8Q8_LOTGI|nr:hypothetical protein LOTGIDRAFT_167971 [Lottia gigantea]ESO85184.1 hypothetical protein LOTGIDRAFT_167971 [Lottia gigantea]